MIVYGYGHENTLRRNNMVDQCKLCKMLGHRIRVPYPFQWGAPTFDAGEAFAMMAASFVALVEV